MSNEIFPSLPGLKWNQAKTPIFSTLVQRTVSGKESRTPLYVYPLYQYDLTFELLRDDAGHNELKNLFGFYLRMGGANDSFLYVDPSDNYSLGGYIGAGDGNNNSFQLIREYGGFIEPVYDVQSSNNAVPIKIWKNGNLVANNAYSINYLNSGLLTFNSTPAANDYITGDLAFYRRVRFAEFAGGDGSVGGGDQAFSQFMRNLWEARSFSLLSVRQEGNRYFVEPPNAILINVLIRNISSNLYQGSNANDPSTVGWGANELGYWWLNTTDPHYKWWNGNEILIMG